MYSRIMFCFVLALLNNHIFAAATDVMSIPTNHHTQTQKPSDDVRPTSPRKSVLEYFERALQQSEFPLSVAQYPSMASKYFNNNAIQAHYPDALIPGDEVLKIIAGASATYAKLSEKPWFQDRIPSFALKEKNGYIQKILLPEKAQVLFFGDLHGSIQALVRVLCKLMALGYLDQNLRLRDNTYMIFLGDFVDYGRNGIDTLSTALHLRAENPDRVFLCRGNHEDATLNATPDGRNGFSIEVNSRYPETAETILERINTLYEQLPVAIFLGIEGHPDAGFAQCCHGGIGAEAETEIQTLISTPEIYFASLPHEAYSSLSEAGNCATNFNWSDFTGKTTVLDAAPSMRDGRTGFLKVYSIKGAQTFMERHFIHAIFRGHQDQQNCCKFLARGIADPVYFFSQAPAIVAQLERSEIQPLVNRLIPSPLALFEEGFLLRDLPKDADNNWIVAPIFTFTNATAARNNDNEGCGILTLGATWASSRLQAYISTTPIMNFRHALLADANVAALADSIFTEETDRQKALAQSALFLQSFRALLLLPSITSIDANGNAQIFIHNFGQYLQNAKFPEKSFFQQLAIKFSLPDGVMPSISQDFLQATAPTPTAASRDDTPSVLPTANAPSKRFLLEPIDAAKPTTPNPMRKSDIPDSSPRTVPSVRSPRDEAPHIGDTPIQQRRAPQSAAIGDDWVEITAEEVKSTPAAPADPGLLNRAGSALSNWWWKK